MTSKNLLISTENPTPILLCKIALRLRCAIFTLIFSTCILWVQSSFAQEFVQLRIADYYHSDQYLNLSSDQAYLAFDYYPSGSITDATILSTADIKRLVDTNYYTTRGVFGLYRNQTVDGVTIRHCLSVITPTNFIMESSSSVTLLFPQIQELLSQKNLGTVEQRRIFINGLSTLDSNIKINPVDFRGYLQPWIVLGLVIAILIPAWYLMRRFLRG